MEKVDTILSEAKSLVFVNIHGLKVADATTIRRKLKSDKLNFFVAKKSLVNKVLESKKYEGNIPEMPGEIALAYGADLVAPAREIFAFQNKLKGPITIVGGIFDGKYMSKEEMTSIASIPPLNTLYGMFVNIINSPIQGLVIAINEIASKK